ncbi:MAG: UDP-N-acetylmuramoyl-L-alanyl-D-glutamate--2,6-diaminopimelate ligase [Bacteriovoracaceae bacterium]|nr:UDP-N-acetylmuramoyl-L-alanyl-D-glutamate--2,6-diaminopimelate ligase [Bacteriovoracaceae bacterium]
MLKRWIESFKAADIWLKGSADGNVDQITSDSRAAEKASGKQIVFFARKGPTKDGHDFLNELSKLPQIAAFVVEKIPEKFETKAAIILVRDATLAMALAAKDFYKNPSGDTFCAAVTGTNGKTTTTFLMESLLQESGKRPARLGTIETHFEKISIPSELTTPDFTVLQKTFSELKQKGADAFVFEASSHALEQNRLLGLELDLALFTNLTPEHLDYHKNMENYFQAKRKLFVELLASSKKKNKIAVLPDDKAYGSRLAEEVRVNSGINVFTWAFEGIPSEQKVIIKTWETNLSGSSVTISGAGKENLKFHSKLIGKYNIENMAGMITAALALKIDPKIIQRSLDSQSPVRGRLERVSVPAGFAFVDYAHTPDALENVLLTLRPLTKGKLKVVFGCGGDRDRYKRPKMGAIAELYADEIFITSDNPRTEDPEAIIQEILNGVQKIKPTHVESDRRLAIEKSLFGLEKNDVLLVAGKGHEDYQILGTTKVAFDDREVILTGIQNQKGKKCSSN